MTGQRDTLRAAFIDDAGWGDAETRPLAGDASTRRYLRLIRPDADTAIVMDADPATDQGTPAFSRMTRYLRSHGFSAPAILAEDIPAGFLLLEDLGEDVFADLIAERPEQEMPLYLAATGCLAALQTIPPDPALPPSDSDHWVDALAPFHDHYLPARGARAGEPARRTLAAMMGDLIRTYTDMPGVTILRDFHAENLIWRPDREGRARVGLLDYQDARIGPMAYDLASLLYDARRDVSPEVRAACLSQFSTETRVSADLLSTRVAICAVQRNLRILGLFQRLADNGGKPGYLDLLPRVRRDLSTALGHPVLTEVRALLQEVLPDA